jgi:hypothetical protein
LYPGPREAGDDTHAGTAARRLEAPDLGGVHADALGEGFLGETVFLAGSAQVCAEVGERVSVGPAKAISALDLCL